MLTPKYSGGGADGSIATFNETELTFPANLGIDDVLDTLGPFLFNHSDTMSPGDLYDSPVNTTYTPWPN